ncbi:thiamine phosphate synthase [Rhizorhapis sp.]|uniref:thiamine phosphate synthase n=1 Tax=Rhizorhapis sp. TaxID=1968842 RepID=UPI002B48BB27|nr:thiamine phosphate synthase [Rhizorhapis sp.]HKR17390.1 thiamine phosphate synthase [Rhizorhapis sp.]
MTDERIPEAALLKAIERLPKGSGVVFRHYSLPRDARRKLFGKVRALSDRRRLTLLLAGPANIARAWGADGFHSRDHQHSRWPLLHSAPVHSLPEIRRAQANGAHLLFLSPLFTTRSHPGARPLGRPGFSQLARATRLPVIALGGVTPQKARAVGALRSYGWAAIDGLTKPFE